MHKRPIAISLSPNTEADDVQLAWRLVTDKKLRSDPSGLREAKQLLEECFGARVTFFSSGRASIAAVLRALGVGGGHEVIVQAFTCVAVPAAVTWTGATPVYADISSTTYNLDPQDVAKKITGRTKAIIVQRTFGMPGPVEELKALADGRNIVLIEDCAHSLGATLHGKPLGTFGDAAILSFGRDKVISSVFGGAVITKDAALHERLRQAAAQLKPAPRWWTAQQLRHPILFNVLLPIYDSGLGKVLLVASQALGLVGKAVTTQEKAGLAPAHVDFAFPPALGHLLSQQVKKLDRYTQRRRQIAARYANALANKNVELPQITAGAEPNWLRYPVQVKDAPAFLQRARQRNIVLGDWYKPVVAPQGVDLAAVSYIPGSCPVAEEVSAHVINLPTYPLLTDAQVEKVIQLFS